MLNSFFSRCFLAVTAALFPGSSSLPQAYIAMAQNTMLNSLTSCFIVFSFYTLIPPMRVNEYAGAGNIPQLYRGMGSPFVFAPDIRILSLSFFTKIALFMFYYKYRYGLILSNCFVFEVICVKMRIMRAKKYDIFS